MEGGVRSGGIWVGANAEWMGFAEGLDVDGGQG